jgi:hypothetical protein
MDLRSFDRFPQVNKDTTILKFYLSVDYNDHFYQLRTVHLPLYHFRVMVFNTTCNNISAISWRSVLFVEETAKNHRPSASHWQTVSQR